MKKLKFSDVADVVIRDKKTGDISNQITATMINIPVENNINSGNNRLMLAEAFYDNLLPYVGENIIIEKSIGNGEISSKEYKVLMNGEEAIVLDEFTE